jgi:hypothetical protein
MAAAPMPQPAVKPVGKGRTIVAWSLSMLAVGLAAGPQLDPYVDQGVEAVMEEVTKLAPGFVQPYLPQPIPKSTPLARASEVARVVPLAPPAVEAARTAPVPSEPTPEVAPQPAAAVAPIPAAPARAVQPERHASQHQAHKAHASRKMAVALPVTEPDAPKAAPKSARHRGRDWNDPFEKDTRAAKPAAVVEHSAKPAPEPVVAKSRPLRSGDSLDDLMADAASAGPSSGRRNSSKSIDAMLQDVQKSHPAPKPARVEPEALPALTTSDIAKAMAGVKSGANACGKRFGQDGVADLRLVVGKDGRVSDVSVRGKLAGSSLAECIAQAARGASFPPNSGLKFNYRIDVQ